MKRASIMITAGCLALGVVAAAAPQMSQRRSQGDDEPAILRGIDDQAAAFNRHPVDRSLFTDDADFVNARGMWLRGADAIERGRQAQFRSFLKAANIRLLDVGVRVVRP